MGAVDKTHYLQHSWFVLSDSTGDIQKLVFRLINLEICGFVGDGRTKTITLPLAHTRGISHAHGNRVN